MSKSHRQRGNEAEDLACAFLEEKGWEILERNYYSGHAEIDIIGRDGDTVVFLEVKMRSDTRFGTPVEFVDEAKVERVFHAAEAWANEQDLRGTPLRFDVIGILRTKNSEPEIRHFEDAYR